MSRFDPFRVYTLANLRVVSPLFFLSRNGWHRERAASTKRAAFHDRDKNRVPEAISFPKEPVICYLIARFQFQLIRAAK